MVDEITHFVDYIFSLMDAISAFGGLDLFSHWQWVD